MQHNPRREYVIEEYTIEEEPYYLPLCDEIEIFEAAFKQSIPLLLKGPTGTGKTRFVEYMAWKLNQPLTRIEPHDKEVKKESGAQSFFPLITVACHEDLTASDLIGRYLLDQNGTQWTDGPLTRAVRTGGICYLDEIVEARKDTTVIIHPLTDHRRILTIDKLGKVIKAADNFFMVISYNPGYQSSIKDLKPSTRQRFIALEFTFPSQEQETQIIMHESKVESPIASRLAELGMKLRNLDEYGLDQIMSTRLLIYAASLMRQGVKARRACQVAVSWGITDDRELQHSIDEVISSLFA